MNKFKEDPNSIRVTPSMVNDFILKTMEITTATVNIKEFTYGILNGYMERLFDSNGVPIID